MRTTKDNYYIYIFSYGIIAVLYTLEYFEKTENYEECQKIIDAINKANKITGVNLETNMTENVIESVFNDFFKSGISREKLLRNYKDFSKIILQELDGL